jgi:hypothetical protein
VSTSCNDRNGVQGAIVSGLLGRQPLQGVPLALDLVSIDGSVDHGEVDPRCPLAQLELVDDQGAGLVAKGNLKIPP